MTHPAVALIRAKSEEIGWPETFKTDLDHDENYINECNPPWVIWGVASTRTASYCSPASAAEAMGFVHETEMIERTYGALRWFHWQGGALEEKPIVVLRSWYLAQIAYQERKLVLRGSNYSDVRSAFANVPLGTLKIGSQPIRIEPLDQWHTYLIVQEPVLP